MAQPALRLSENVAGDFFVDSSCIDCDACRQIAPAVFHEAGDQSAVFHQPESDAELLAAQKALLACPTGSIGDLRKRDLAAAIAAKNPDGSYFYSDAELENLAAEPGDDDPELTWYGASK